MVIKLKILCKVMEYLAETESQESYIPNQGILGSVMAI